MIRRSLPATILAALLSAAPAVGETPAATTTTPYQTLEIQPFEIPADIHLPSDFQSALADNLIEQMGKTRKFPVVVTAGQNHPNAAGPVLRLSGSITEFKKGSQAKRYLLGPGFGKTILKARVRFIDAATGEVKLEKEVDGKVIMGLLWGDSRGATNGLAKEVAKVVKKRF